MWRSASSAGRDARGVDAGEEAREVVDLHRRALGDVAAVDRRAERGLVEPRAAALRARLERRDALDRRADVRLRGLDVLGEEGALEAVDEALPLEVQAADLDLRLGPAQELLPLRVGVVGELLVGVEEARLGVHAPAPGVDAEVRQRDRALVERQAAVDHRVDVDRRHAAHPLALRAHALRVVEREQARVADVRLARAGCRSAAASSRRRWRCRRSSASSRPCAPGRRGSRRSGCAACRRPAGRRSA